MERFSLGIDEVGRGSIAGPVSVGGCIMLNENIKKHIAGAKDSKLYTPKARDKIFAELMTCSDKGLLFYYVASRSPSFIDEFGIQKSIYDCVVEVCKNLITNIEMTDIFLDGGLKTLEKYNQETIIGGDRLFSIISAASIIAKVTRDKYMNDQASIFKDFSFDKHKGYGTAGHYAELKSSGQCILHRKTYIH